LGTTAEGASSSKSSSSGEQASHLQFCEKKYDAKHPHQVHTTTALVSFVAESLMPLSIAE